MNSNIFKALEYLIQEPEVYEVKFEILYSRYVLKIINMNAKYENLIVSTVSSILKTAPEKDNEIIFRAPGLPIKLVQNTDLSEATFIIKK